MDLECISIGSKVPAVGGCPRLLGPSWKCRWAVPPPALAAPSPVFRHYRTCFTERPLQLHWGPHMEWLGVVPLSWCLQGTAICHTPCSSRTPLFHFFRCDWGPCSTNISTLVGRAWYFQSLKKVVQITPGVSNHEKLFDTNAADILKRLYPSLQNRWYCWQPPIVIEAIVPHRSYLIGISMQWMSLCNCITVMYPLHSLRRTEKGLYFIPSETLC